MSIETRRDMLVRYLRENGRTSVKELADYFNITGATVRSDLRFLEQAQLVMRRYGGAEAFNGAALEDRTMDEKTTLNLNIKQRIGAKAASLVQNGESIVLDSGSTTLQMVPWLAEHVGVGAVPGSTFFRENVNHLIRLHFAKKEDTLCEALNRLSEIDKKWQSTSV